MEIAGYKETEDRLKIILEQGLKVKLAEIRKLAPDLFGFKLKLDNEIEIGCMIEDKKMVNPSFAEIEAKTLELLPQFNTVITFE